MNLRVRVTLTPTSPPPGCTLSEKCWGIETLTNVVGMGLGT